MRGHRTLDDPGCVGAATLDDGSRDSSTILELGKVVGSLQITGCVLLLWGHCTGQVLCATGSDRESSGSEGHELGSKGDHLTYRVFARSKLQKAAGCRCESRDFWWKVPVVLGNLRLPDTEFKC